MRPLNPPLSTPGPVAGKAHGQAWSNVERKQVCEYAEAQHKLPCTRLPWKQIKSWWEAKNSDNVCLCVNRITGCCLYYVIDPVSIANKCPKRTTGLIGNADSAPLHNQERKRQRPVAYPRLHEAFFVWMKAIEKVVTITGAIIQAKAAELFPRPYPNETAL